MIYAEFQRSGGGLALNIRVHLCSFVVKKFEPPRHEAFTKWIHAKTAKKAQRGQL